MLITPSEMDMDFLIGKLSNPLKTGMIKYPPPNPVIEVTNPLNKPEILSHQGLLFSLLASFFSSLVNAVLIMMGNKTKTKSMENFSLEYQVVMDKR